MDPQFDDKILENAIAESLTDLVPDAKTVSEDEFIEVVGGALEAVGGRCCSRCAFKTQAKASTSPRLRVGDGGNRHFASHLADRRWRAEGRNRIEKHESGGRNCCCLCRPDGRVSGCSLKARDKSGSAREPCHGAAGCRRSCATRPPDTSYGGRTPHRTGRDLSWTRSLTLHPAFNEIRQDHHCRTLPRHRVVGAGDAIVASSTNAKLLSESPYPPVFYIPFEDIDSTGY